MPFAYKWLGIAAVLIAMLTGAYLKGRSDANEKWEAESAKIKAAAAEEKARVLKERGELVEKHQQKEEADEKTIADLTAANRGLLNTVAGFRRTPTLTVPSASYCEAGKLLDSCAGLLQEVAGRGAERLGTCLNEYSDMAKIAESERGKAELAGAVYESIRKRTK